MRWEVDVKYRAFTSKRTFGVEVEYTRDVSGFRIYRAVREADRGHECELIEQYVQDVRGHGWQVKKDGSIHLGHDPYGWEVSSFKGSGWRDIATVERVFAEIKKLGVKVNGRCGVHIHAGADDINSRRLAGVVAQWMRIEPLVFQMVPAARTRSQYCRPLRSRLDYARNRRPIDRAALMDRVESKVNGDGDTRRSALNVVNLVEGDRPTLEFRLPEGTVEPSEVGNWIRFFLGFVDTARRTGYDGSLAPAGVDDLLVAVGLKAKEGRCLILSRGLHKTKVWALRRISKHGKDEARKKAIELLDYIGVPGEQAPAR